MRYVINYFDLYSNFIVFFIFGFEGVKKICFNILIFFRELLLFRRNYLSRKVTANFLKIYFYFSFIL